LNAHLLVFGDQVVDKRPMIRNLVRNSKSSPAARRFLQEATDVVQIELAQLTPDEHGWAGSFESLLGLAEEHAAREANGTALLFITSLLALIGRLGDLIVRAERDPTILGSKEKPVHVLALCAGQLPAAAAVAARDTSELFTIARETISITCRWMRAVHRNRLAMILPNQVEGGWCITYPGLDPTRAQVILDEFHASQGIPTLHRVAIGVVSRSWLSLVGPPTSLRRLAEFSPQEIGQAPQIPADVGAPAHAPYMLGADAEEAVGHSAMLDRALDWVKVTMVAPSDECEPRRFSTLRELLCDVFEDVLLRRLLVDKTIESSVARLPQNATISVHEIGSTTHMPSVLKALAAVGLPYDVMPAYSPPPPGSAPAALTTRGTSDLIAIVGMSGRFPGSDNVDEFWRELLGGACHIKKVPESRYDVDRYYDPTQKLKNSTAVRDGAWLKDPGFFDNRFFNVSPREAAQMDPVQRLCLTTTHEALEMAGYAPHASPSMNPDRVATFVGVTGWDWLQTLHQQGHDIYYTTGVAKAFVPGKINYHYRFGRGSYTLDSVCASSTTAIALACKGLLARDCDMAVAGGGSVFSSPLDLAGVDQDPGVPFQINHRFPRLDRRHVRIALETATLRASPKSADGKIRMLVNTFDASGGNCSLVVEEAPDGADAPRDDDVRRPSHVVAVSARSALSLQRNCETLLGYLERNPNTRLSDLAYTTTARRMHSTLRRAFVCSSTGDLARQIRQRQQQQQQQPMDTATKKPQAPRVVFLFTGQGSQYDAMGMTLYKTSKRFRDMMDTYQLTASHMGLPEFLSIISSGTLSVAAASPAQVQLAMVALELGIAHMLRTWGIIPDVVVGHSLGEYAALCVADVLSPSDALYLVGRRALLMEQRLAPDTHAMLAVALAAPDLQVRIRWEQEAGNLSASCALACVNSPQATVASGTVSDVRALQGRLSGEGVRSTFLRVPFGFHSAQVEPVLAEFEQAAAAGIALKKPIVPVASTLTGQMVDTEGVFGPGYLARQAREPVNFLKALETIKSSYPSGASVGSSATLLWIETGPDAVCLGMVRKTLDDVDAECLLPALSPQKDNWETTARMLKTAYERGLQVNWRDYHGEFSDGLALLSDLPAYTWDYKNFWTPYTVPPAWEIDEALDAATNGRGNSPNQTAQDVNSGFVPTMCLQKLVVEEKIDTSAETETAVFSSDTSAPALKKAVEGHVVNGHAVMPLAVFCDMALTSARHCHSRLVHGSSLESTQMTLHDMVLTKAIALTPDSSPVVLTTAGYTRSSRVIGIAFNLASEKGKPGPSVGSCRIAIAAAVPKPLAPEQNQTLFLVKTRMQQLRDLAAAGSAHRLLRPVVYRLFGDYVRYNADYRSLDEVMVSAGSQDALASLTAPTPATTTTTNCALGPFLYDGVHQLTGFLLNNSIRSEDDDQTIYIAEGFGESRQWEPLVPGRKYTSYASGQDVDGSSGAAVVATSYVFDAESSQLVQMLTGIRFQKMKKAVLDRVLGVSVSTPMATKTQRALSSLDGVARKAVPSPSRTIKAPNNNVAETPVPPVSKPATSPGPDPNPAPDISLVVRDLLAIVAAEVGVAPEDMTDEVVFGDLGVDSLMAITVLSRTRNELGLDLSPAFFMDCETVGSAKQALLMMRDDEGGIPRSFRRRRPRHRKSDISSAVEGVDPETAWVHVDESPLEMRNMEPLLPPEHHQVAPQTSTNDIETTIAKVETAPAPACKILHLQGNPEPSPATTSPTIFLLADETGSSISYVQLPSLGGSCVYGVDWPAVDSDLAADDLLSSLVGSIAASITAHAAPPPYILGGVSFGAVLAVQVARRMPTAAAAAAAAADIRGVLLLDPPAGAEDVTRTKERLAKTRVLRPAQGARFEAAARAVGCYRFDVAAWGGAVLARRRPRFRW
ncbi:polyketide synthase protein, partial [Apiospora saccharicola]